MRTGLAAALCLAALLTGCAAPIAELHARAGDFAVLDLQGYDAAGRNVLNLTAVHAVLGGEVPARLPEGWDANLTQPLPAGVREALAGARPGETRDTALLSPERAYGPWREDKTIRMPLRMNLSRTVQVAGSELEPRYLDPHCDVCGVAVAYSLRWANATWDARIVGHNGTTETVRLEGGPANGSLLELPDVWNAQYHLWRSRLVASDAANLTVEQEMRETLGSTVLVGGQPYRVRADAANGTALADGNHPLARASLRFHVLLRELAFVGDAGFPVAPDAVLVSLDSQRFNLSELRGQPVLLDFFATWCVTCKQQAGVLERVQAAHPGLRVVSITIDPLDSEAKVRSFQAESLHGSANWTWAFD
ncbi:MAG: TlpA family protein disulfide reductase, partial [Halobacteriales archaeon]|nr:TlpA family protein disulfide reductase [Halobacteriales archaeon]